MDNIPRSAFKAWTPCERQAPAQAVNHNADSPLISVPGGGDGSAPNSAFDPSAYGICDPLALLSTLSNQAGCLPVSPGGADHQGYPPADHGVRGDVPVTAPQTASMGDPFSHLSAAELYQRGLLPIPMLSMEDQGGGSQMALLHDPAAVRLHAELQAAFEGAAGQASDAIARGGLREPSIKESEEFIKMFSAACFGGMWREQKINQQYAIKFIDNHPELDLDYSTKTSAPPLGLAVVKGRRDLIKKLLAGGAKLDVAWQSRNDKRTVTPLLLAIQEDTAPKKGNVNTTPLLLDAGADPEFAGWATPLEYAQQRIAQNPKNARIIVLLLEKAIGDGDPFDPDRLPPRPADQAVKRQGTEMLSVGAKKRRLPSATETVPPRVDAALLNMGSAKSKDEIQSWMPFNIAGNKSELLASSIGKLLEIAARASNRVIDAFGGAGTYIHYLRGCGISYPGDILNEYDSMRAITHRQIATDPEGVVEAAREFVNALHTLAREKGVQTGNIFTTDTDSARKDLITFIRDQLQSQMVKKAAEGKTSVILDDTPRVAGRYLVLQAMTVNKQPVQSEMRPHGLAFPGFRFIMAEGGFKNGGNVKVGGKIKLFQAEPLIDRIEKKVLGAYDRTQGLNVRQGDGWTLIASEAKEGDLVTVDSSYLHPTVSSGRECKQTINYSRDTVEDADPDTYKRKLDKYVVPAWDRGARLLITNNWNDIVVSYLLSLGFDVRKSFRTGARNSEQETGAAELVAINFNPDTGAVIRRPGGVVAVAVG